ncbi:Crp/Fnr family transcriptional regulator [Nocardiopsis sp. NPDC050513]|uniref:Crp/Fnr family transcriptional regulator n=1 Tax=Nocardiopsis sp. NPDC050513 TaxID=3364338 RepID=UPI00379424DA
MSPNVPTRADLCATPLLSGLPERAVDDFLRLARTRLHRRGTRLFSEGEPGGCVYLLLSGKVKVTRPGLDGTEILSTMVGPGELLGELTAFDGAPRHADATVVRDSAVVRIPAPALLDWLRRNPAASLRMMSLLAERVRRMNDRLEDSSGADVATRVARALVEHAARFGRRTSEGLRFALDLRQDELAHHLRASRERVNQVLVDFSRRGWIERDGEEFVVLDPAALTRRARYRPETAHRRPSVLPVRYRSQSP